MDIHRQCNGNSGFSRFRVINVVDTTAPDVHGTGRHGCPLHARMIPATWTITGDVLKMRLDACGYFRDCRHTQTQLATSNCFGGDAIVRTWTATDDCGNMSFCGSNDHIGGCRCSVLHFCSSRTLSWSAADALPMDMATAEDVCSGATVTMAQIVEGDANCTGMAVITRTFTATDGCGNVSTAQQTITRIDTEAPVASVADASMTCEEYDSATEYGSYEVSDNCMSEVVVSWAEVSNTQEGSNGCFVAEREYTFTDGCGNSSSVIQTITVTDDVAPVMDEVAAAVELQCGDVMPAMPSATDNCSAVEVTFEDVETTMGCSGEMNFIRTYTATDACGNSVSASQEVTFNDLIAPTFTAPMDVTVECDSRT